MYLSPVLVRHLLDNSMGRMLAVDYVKVDGEPRTVHGKLAPLSPSMEGKEHLYLNIQLAHKPGERVQYRNVKVDSVRQIRINGQVFTG